MRGPGVLVALACVAAGASFDTAATGTTTIFKCFDRKLGVLYTDQPCAGEALEIHAGQADPAAVAELAREREALSKSAAQRIADQRRAAYERDLATVSAWPPVTYQSAEGGGGAYAPAWFGWGAPPRDQRPRTNDNRPQRRERTSFVPNPPPNLRSR